MSRMKVYWIESTSKRIEIEVPDEATASERLTAARQAAAFNAEGRAVSSVHWDTDDGHFGGEIST